MITTSPLTMDARPVESPTFGVRECLVFVAVLSLPFTYALTVNLGFPLKVYEVCLAVVGMSYLFDLKISIAPSVPVLVRPLIAFLVAALLLLAFRAAWPLSTLETGAYSTRFGPLGDGIAAFLYLCLSAFGFVTFSYYAFRHERRFLRVWILGAAIAAAYAWYTFIASALGHAPLLLPGIEEAQRFNIGSLNVIRSGTFKEGNFLGLYLVASVAVALYARRKIPAVFLSLTVFITFSTANTIGLAVLWFGFAWNRVGSRQGIGRRALYIFGVLIVATVGVGILVATGYLGQVVVGKLVLADPTSSLDRLDQAVAGLRMFFAHPFVGVGLAQYGYHYRAYQYTDLFDSLRVYKPIPNNVYIELLSELGLGGFLLFSAFLRNIYRTSWGRELTPLRWGLVAMLLVFNAFPSYVIMFVWAYFGLIVAAAARQHGLLDTRSSTLPDAL